ncbi:MAG: DNA methyltransferase [Bacteroidota bacterium]
MLIEKKEFGDLVNPSRNRQTPIFNWHSFKHSYSRDLVERLIQEFNLKPGSWVLDPFCGGGTTLLTCKQHDINSTGFDILPFSVFLSNVKTREYDEVRLMRELKKLISSRKHGSTRGKFPDIPLLKKAFAPHVKKELLLLKSRINDIKEDEVRDFFTLAFLGILESVSNTSKAGGFLRLVERDTKTEDISSLFLARSAEMISDVIKNGFIQKKSSSSVKALIGDARKLPTKRKFDAVITSPPYPNRHDYTRIYSLEMVFDFVFSNDELKQIRYDTLRSHVEARKRYEPKGYSKPKRLTNLISRINRNGTNNPQVIEMIEGYFEDMYLSLSEMKRCMRKKGKIGLVVSNVRFAGISVPVDELLAEIGEQVGLSTKTIWVARHRGNSSQQMKTYKRKTSRESIVIWEKRK